jgi:RNA polymerase sigma-70 factor, ECF subfamily
VTESPLLLQELLRKTGRGDAEAFALLYKHTSGKLFGVAIRIAGPGEIAEDAVQECFVTVWQRAADYDPMRGAAMSWLLAILRNCVIDRARQHRAGRRYARLAGLSRRTRGAAAARGTARLSLWSHP